MPDSPHSPAPINPMPASGSIHQPSQPPQYRQIPQIAQCRIDHPIQLKAQGAPDLPSARQQALQLQTANSPAARQTLQEHDAQIYREMHATAWYLPEASAKQQSSASPAPAGPIPLP